MKHIEHNLLVELRSLLSSGHTPVLYSGRGQLHFDSETKSRLFSVQLSQLMARLASSVAAGLGYLISKGGTTTQALLSYGLSLSSVHLEGQLLPGLSIVRPLMVLCLAYLSSPSLGIWATARLCSRLGSLWMPADAASNSIG